MHSCLRHRALKLKPHAAVLKIMMTARATYPTFLPLASGLAAVHKKGLVHRDIKPTECCIRYPVSNPGHSANEHFPSVRSVGSAGSVFIWSCIWDFRAFSRSPSYAEVCWVCRDAFKFRETLIACALLAGLPRLSEDLALTG